MNLVMAVLAIFFWLISLVLMFRLLRSGKGVVDKVGGCMLLLVPVFGPFLYYFVIDPPSVKAPELRTSGIRGEYTHRWIALREVLGSGLKRRSEREKRRGE